MKYVQSLTFDFIDMLNFDERPFRAKLIPAKIWDDLDRFENDKYGLTNYFKKWRTKIEWRYQKSTAAVYETYVAIGGEYDPETRQCVLQLYTLNYNSFKFTQKSWDAFKYRLIQTLMHEIIHFMQFDRRGDEWSTYVVPYKKIGKKRIDQERAYLSEFDEIQAYAHCVYLDFKMYRPAVPVSELLARAKRRVDSKTLHYFLKTFNYDYRNNAAVPKIIKQVGKWERKYSLNT